MLQQLRTGSIQIYSDLVDARFDYELEPFIQILFRQIMLILSDADCLRINFDQFCQRILQTACDADRGTLFDVEVREFFSGNFACLIDRSTGLVDDYVGDFFIDFL